MAFIAHGHDCCAIIGCPCFALAYAQFAPFSLCPVAFQCPIICICLSTCRALQLLLIRARSEILHYVALHPHPRTKSKKRVRSTRRTQSGRSDASDSSHISIHIDIAERIPREHPLRYWDKSPKDDPTVSSDISSLAQSSFTTHVFLLV